MSVVASMSVDAASWLFALMRETFLGICRKSEVAWRRNREDFVPDLFEGHMVRGASKFTFGFFRYLAEIRSQPTHNVCISNSAGTM